MNAACMGGWCAIREKCSYYHAEPRERFSGAPFERLCEPGKTDAFVPLMFVPKKELESQCEN